MDDLFDTALPTNVYATLLIWLCHEIITLFIAESIIFVRGMTGVKARKALPHVVAGELEASCLGPGAESQLGETFQNLPYFHNNF